VTVVAIIHDGKTEINQGGQFTLQTEDILVLLGEPEKIDLAIRILQPTTQYEDGFNA